MDVIVSMGHTIIHRFVYVFYFVPVTRRRGNRFLELDSNRHLYFYLLQDSRFLHDLMVFLYGDLDIKFFHDYYRDFELFDHFNLNRNINPSLGYCLYRDFLCNVDIINHGFIVGLVDPEHDGNVLGNFLLNKMGFFDGEIHVAQGRNFPGDRLNVVLRNLLLLSNNYDLGLSW